MQWPLTPLCRAPVSSVLIIHVDWRPAAKRSSYSALRACALSASIVLTCPADIWIPLLWRSSKIFPCGTLFAWCWFTTNCFRSLPKWPLSSNSVGGEAVIYEPSGSSYRSLLISVTLRLMIKFWTKDSEYPLKTAPSGSVDLSTWTMSVSSGTKFLGVFFLFLRTAVCLTFSSSPLRSILGRGEIFLIALFHRAIFGVLPLVHEYV